MERTRLNWHRSRQPRWNSLRSTLRTDRDIDHVLEAVAVSDCALHDPKNRKTADDVRWQWGGPCHLRQTNLLQCTGKPDAAKMRCVQRREPSDRTLELATLFQKYCAKFGFDWLMLAAQGYQESGLRQDRKSPVGAIGAMQVKPSTAADRNVGIDDVTDVDMTSPSGQAENLFSKIRIIA